MCNREDPVWTGVGVAICGMEEVFAEVVKMQRGESASGGKQNV